MTGTNYVGPFNALDEEYIRTHPPTDIIDQGAKEHDEKYSELAKLRDEKKITQKEADKLIRESDEKFLRNIRDNYKANPWASLLGYAGIKGKTLAEDYLGLDRNKFVAQGARKIAKPYAEKYLEVHKELNKFKGGAKNIKKSLINKAFKENLITKEFIIEFMKSSEENLKKLEDKITSLIKEGIDYLVKKYKNEKLNMKDDESLQKILNDVDQFILSNNTRALKKQNKIRIALAKKIKKLINKKRTSRTEKTLNDLIKKYNPQVEPEVKAPIEPEYESESELEEDSDEKITTPLTRAEIEKEIERFREYIDNKYFSSAIRSAATKVYKNLMVFNRSRFLDEEARKLIKDFDRQYLSIVNGEDDDSDWDSDSDEEEKKDDNKKEMNKINLQWGLYYPPVFQSNPSASQIDDFRRDFKELMKDSPLNARKSFIFTMNDSAQRNNKKYKLLMKCIPVIQSIEMQSSGSDTEVNWPLNYNMMQFDGRSYAMVFQRKQKDDGEEYYIMNSVGKLTIKKEWGFQSIYIDLLRGAEGAGGAFAMFADMKNLIENKDGKGDFITLKDIAYINLSALPHYGTLNVYDREGGLMKTKEYDVKETSIKDIFNKIKSEDPETYNDFKTIRQQYNTLKTLSGEEKKVLEEKLMKNFDTFWNYNIRGEVRRGGLPHYYWVLQTPLKEELLKAMPSFVNLVRFSPKLIMEKQIQLKGYGIPVMLINKNKMKGGLKIGKRDKYENIFSKPKEEYYVESNPYEEYYQWGF